MKTKEEITHYINKFIQEQTQSIITLQDNIMLGSALESGEFDYRACYGYLSSFRKDFSEAMDRFTGEIPVVDVKSIEKNLEYTLAAAQDLRYSNSANPIIDIEVQKMVDSIFDDVYNIKRELKIL